MNKHIKNLMTKNVSLLFFVLFFVIVFIVFFAYFYEKNKYINSLVEENNILTHKIKKIEENSFIIINKQTLTMDMEKRFPQFSDKVAKIIVNTIMEESARYEINPIILYSLGIVESSHRYWAEHNQVKIDISKNSNTKEEITTRAAGWGGIVWELHKDLLIKKGIAEQKSDLFYPDVNIKAAAAIYDLYRKMPLKSGINHKDISAQLRYFGGNFKEYADKIKLQIVEIMALELYKDDDCIKQQTK